MSKPKGEEVNTHKMAENFKKARRHLALKTRSSSLRVPTVMAVETELYTLLGVTPHASDTDIKKAYRVKVRSRLFLHKGS